ncbi:hypothetical protein [Natronorubrum halophilum]|uniref:hypothetical protein n=1 Tax=Natronorubrum halophilum TaxID=1702106 RepID=UPI0010C1A942|nr:hypothetical protein [Natronorubrum halophilum]
MIDTTTDTTHGRRLGSVSSAFARGSGPRRECREGGDLLENEQLVDRKQAVDSDNGENDP